MRWIETLSQFAEVCDVLRQDSRSSIALWRKTLVAHSRISEIGQADRKLH